MSEVVKAPTQRAAVIRFLRNSVSMTAVVAHQTPNKGIRFIKRKEA